jgi:hypothetical protein
MATGVNRVSGRVRDTIWGVKVGPKIIYAWKGSSDPTQGVAGISDEDLIADLGLINISEAKPSGFIVVMGANAPKPPRLSKKGTNGDSVTTFCDPAKFSNALRKGYSIASRGRSRGVTGSAQKDTAVVEIYGLLYCWPAYPSLFTAGGGELATLCGIEKATTKITSAAETARVVFGTSRPRPAEGTFQILSGTGSTKNPTLKLFVSEEKEADETLIAAAKSLRASIPSL